MVDKAEQANSQPSAEEGIWGQVSQWLSTLPKPRSERIEETAAAITRAENAVRTTAANPAENLQAFKTLLATISPSNIRDGDVRDVFNRVSELDAKNNTAILIEGPRGPSRFSSSLRLKSEYRTNLADSTVSALYNAETALFKAGGSPQESQQALAFLKNLGSGVPLDRREARTVLSRLQGMDQSENRSPLVCLDTSPNSPLLVSQFAPTETAEKIASQSGEERSKIKPAAKLAGVDPGKL